MCNKISFIPLLLVTSVLAATNSLVPATSVDKDKWYAIYNDSSFYWDSNHGGILDLTTSLGASDKGQRFQFPEGLNSGYGATPIRCQAHEDHYVNVDYSVDGSIFMYAKMLDSGNLDVTSQKGSGGNLQISLTARKDEDSTETYINYLLKLGDSDLRYWNIAEIDAAS